MLTRENKSIENKPGNHERVKKKKKIQLPHTRAKVFRELVYMAADIIEGREKWGTSVFEVVIYLLYFLRLL